MALGAGAYLTNSFDGSGKVNLQLDPVQVFTWMSLSGVSNQPYE